MTESWRKAIKSAKWRKNDLISLNKLKFDIIYCKLVFYFFGDVTNSKKWRKNDVIFFYIIQIKLFLL